MDNLTHSLLGVTLARSGLAQHYGRGTTALMVVASNIVDVDTIFLFTNRAEAAWMRRMHTHCIVGAPLVTLVLAVIWWLGSRRRMPLPAALMLSALGVGSHVLLDVFNSYGVVLLFPFSRERFELAWVYIIDLALWAILLAPLLLKRPLAGRVSELRLYRIALALFVVYVGVCAAGHASAERVLARTLSSAGIHADFTWVFPEALGPHRWRGVSREGNTWRMWLIRVPSGEAELALERRTAAFEPGVAAARATERGRTIEWFFKAPVWSVDPEQRVATCIDLRFMSVVLRGRRTAPFEYALPIAGGGGR